MRILIASSAPSGLDSLRMLSHVLDVTGSRAAANKKHLGSNPSLLMTSQSLGTVSGKAGLTSVTDKQGSYKRTYNSPVELKC